MKDKRGALTIWSVLILIIISILFITNIFAESLDEERESKKLIKRRGNEKSFT